MPKLSVLWDDLRSSMWLLPTLLVVAAVAMAVGLVEAESLVGREALTRRWPRLFGAGAEGSRGLLAAIAGSMITVAGVTFSITVVALTLASSQYTSRILRNFMRDRANQAVLGVFVGVFAYALVVLRTIRGGDEGLFVPALAVLVALLLAFAAIGCLIFFIHHITTSIQATSIIEAVADETLAAIERLFPAAAHDRGMADDAGHDIAGLAWAPVAAPKSGYLQGVDSDALLAFAREHDAVVRMDRAVGEFVIEGSPLVSVAGAANDAWARRLDAACAVGRNRTVQQDVGYGIRQIVDVALKALSPGINDTTTAINCVDFLGAILARLATRRIEMPWRYDGERLRVVPRGPTFAGLLAEAFDQIRQNAGGNVAVLARLHEVLRLVAQRTTDAQRHRALRAHAELICETAERSVPLAQDRATVRAAAGDGTGAM